MYKLHGLIVALAIAAPLPISAPAQAGVDYCHYVNGKRVCITTVFGKRHNRGMVFTVNGKVYSRRFNCYDYNYGSTSIAAVACWNYTGISSEPKSIPSANTITEEVKGIMTGGGFIPEDQAIDLEKVKNAMPDEMR